MRLHRFIGEYDLSKKTLEIKDENTVKQIKNVLRLSTGNRVLLSDGKGKEAEALIGEIFPKMIIVDILNVEISNQKGKEVHLYMSILKKENFELAIQKAVECGASSITPIITDRTVKTGFKKDRLETIIKEASEQSGRVFVPTLNEVLKFDDALMDAKKFTQNILFDLETNDTKIEDSKDATGIFIGPEGGFTQSEVKKAQDTGVQIKSLGHLTLRAETAAIVAVYKIVNT